ncbi:MAG: hypothetical protein J0L88_11085 [Xanthomonadales bacterium]|nr:hypothetical protein [Xanthomonadales bacterium]
MTEPDAATSGGASARSASVRRSLRWFFAEFLVVVAGILVAMALNSVYQARQDAQNEQVYLKRLSRDLQDTIDSLQESEAYELKQFDNGLAASHALAASTPPADREAVAVALSRLGERRTQLLRNPTYADMLHTGNLRLIGDPALRDRINRFYQDVEFRFQIINRNNTALIDDSYRQRVLVSGLVMPRIGSNLPSLAERDARLAEQLGDALRLPDDPLWSLPADSREWAIVRGNLRLRLMIASATTMLVTQSMAEARALKEDLDRRLSN